MTRKTKTKKSKIPKNHTIHQTVDNRPALIDILVNAFGTTKLDIEWSRHSDGSGTWLEARKKDKNDDTQEYIFCFQLNDAGTELQDLNFLVERFERVGDGGKKIC